MSSIGYYKRKDIDIVRWDNCIDLAANSLIYAKTAFLDCMCSHWGAFILGDYEAVMPIPWKRKFGISFVYQPMFCQQLGVFGTALSAELVNQFLQEMRRRFRFAELAFNYDNPLQNAVSRINYCLDLSKRYSEIQLVFKPSLKNHIRKGQSFGLKYEHASDLKECVFAFMNDIKLKQAGVKTRDLIRFQSLCEKLGKNGYIIRKVIDGRGEVCSMGLLLLDTKRVYNIFSTTTDQGRVMRSNHFLLSNLINEFSGSGKLLDFEGSMLPGVKVFFESFGAFNQPYYFHRHNLLPFPYSLFKK